MPEDADKPDVTRIAACACGRLSANCRGTPRKVSLCHCLG